MDVIKRDSRIFLKECEHFIKTLMAYKIMSL